MTDTLLNIIGGLVLLGWLVMGIAGVASNNHFVTFMFFMIGIGLLILNSLASQDKEQEDQ